MNSVIVIVLAFLIIQVIKYGFIRKNDNKDSNKDAR